MVSSVKPRGLLLSLPEKQHGRKGRSLCLDRPLLLLLLSLPRLTADQTHSETAAPAYLHMRSIFRSIYRLALGREEYPRVEFPFLLRSVSPDHAGEVRTPLRRHGGERKREEFFEEIQTEG